MKRYLVVKDKESAKSLALSSSEMEQCTGERWSKYIHVGSLAKTAEGDIIVEIPPELKALLESLQDLPNIYDELNIRKLLPKGDIDDRRLE